MKETDTFKLLISNNYFKKNDILETVDSKLLVISTPKRKWYHLILQFISFGLFKASHYYKVKSIK